MSKFFSSSINYELPKSRISDEQYEAATNKLLYEISLRKSEFMNLCAENAKNFSNKIESTTFRTILDKFTSYLNDFEKSLIIHKYTVNDEFIDYEFLAGIKSTFKEKHEDAFLSHLNRDVTMMRTKRIDITPMQKLNSELNEENFMIKIAKNVVKDIMINANEKGPWVYLSSLLTKSDSDNDEKFTIGELNSFLNSVDVYLNDSDLRFFFEKFHIFKGRLDIPQLENYIKTSSKKNYSQTARTDFAGGDENEENNALLKEYIAKEENKDEKYFNEIMKKNVIIAILKECLLIFGKKFLFNYFGKYVELYNNKFYIDTKYLELGIHSLGYEVPSSLESNNFKLLCVNRRIVKMKEDMELSVNLEELFEFIVEFFNLGNLIKPRSNYDIIAKMSSGLINKMNDMFLLSVTDKINKSDVYDSKINEFEFRKKFIKSFGFIDHDFFDRQIHNLGKKNFLNNIDNDIKSPNDFKLQQLDSENYLHFIYNMTFLAMIKNYLSLGILIDDEDALLITAIGNKIKNKLFPEGTDNNGEIDSYRRKIDMRNIGRALPIKSITPNLRIDEPMMMQKNIFHEEKKEYVLAKFKNDTTTINELSPNDYIAMKKKNSKSKEENKKENFDHMTAIKIMFTVCKDYIADKYKIENLTYEKISNLGICKLFKDEFAKYNISIKEKINLNSMINVFDAIFRATHRPRGFDEDDINDVITFLSSYIHMNSDTEGNITVYLFIQKIEEVLLEYSKHFYLNNI